MVKNKRVLLGMSGGVDSSVAAILLKEAGYEVVGATMELWEENGNNSLSSATNDAKKICNQLGIEHHVLECKKEFKKHVIDNFVDCYKCALTPNPCIECNKYLKFGTFYKKALELDCTYISTGHYAKIEFSKKYNQYVMKKSEVEGKDQTYFLYNIPKEILPNIILPLENIGNKEQVRNIAEKYNLKVAKKPDSQEICFITNNKYTEFLIKNLSEGPKEGNIVNTNGKILGKHKGLIYYTIGQRKGLGISSKTPLYVIDLDNKNNQLIVGEEKELFSTELYANDLNYLIPIDFEKPIEVKAKIRYAAKESEATIYKQDNETVKVVFEQLQRAITPGQSVAFYIDDVLIGGGKILKNIDKY